MKQQQQNHEVTQGLLEVTDLFISLIAEMVVIVSQAYEYV